jgi:hypothetical protein
MIPKSLPADLIRGWNSVSRLREARFGGRRKSEKIMRKQIVHAQHATWLIREEWPFGPFIVREFIPHDSRLQFGSLNHANPDAFSTEPAFPRLPANWTYRGHGKIDQNDPHRTSAHMKREPTDRPYEFCA